mgnify:CR=1 FL=1
MISNVLFLIYSESLDISKVEMITRMIEEVIPDALYMGVSTNGNIIMGDKSPGQISIVCTVYEYPSTRIKILQYPLTEEVSKEVSDSPINEIKGNPWVKSVTAFTTMRGMSMTKYCDYLGAIPKEIAFCGGGAISENINETAAFVFSSEGSISDHATVFLLT